MGSITEAVAERAAAIEKRRQAAVPLLEAIMQAESLFATALRGSEISPAQFVTNAINVIKQDLIDPYKKTKIIECEQESVIGALLNCAQSALRPGPFKEAWIIPKRKLGGSVLAEFQAHYRGLQRLALAHPEIDRITTRVVFAADFFDVKEGSVNRLDFTPLIGSQKERGDRRAFFSLAKLANGETPFVWRSETDMTAFRDRFVEAGTSSPWFDAYGYQTMGCKTVLLRLLDEIPRSARLVELVAVDGTVRRDLDPAAPGYEVGEHIDDHEASDPEQEPIDLDAEVDRRAEQG